MEFENRKLNVYSYMKHSAGFKWTHQRQAMVSVACASQKRAAELFGVSSSDIASFGGITGQKPVQEMCRAEPEVVFVELSHGTYCRETEIDDLDKTILLDMKNEELYGRETEHAAFGTIEVNRYQGESDLFMVNYPTGHGISISISTAKLNRTGASDRVFQDREIIRIEMSEVQWAQMVASMNAGTTPCTLKRYHHPVTGDFMTPKLPQKHAADMDTFREDIEARARKALADVTEARAKLAEVLKGPLRKGDLNEIQDLLNRAERNAIANMGYVTERAHETIQTATDHAKAEIDAHIDFSMMKLGERALGDRLALAQAKGVDITDFGRQVATLLEAPAKED